MNDATAKQLQAETSFGEGGGSNTDEIVIKVGGLFHYVKSILEITDEGGASVNNVEIDNDELSSISMTATSLIIETKNEVYDVVPVIPNLIKDMYIQIAPFISIKD